MSARAKFKAKKAWTRADKRKAGIIAGVVLGAFVIGYGVTALSFTSGVGIDVITVPDVRTMTLAEARRAIDRAELELAVGDSFPNAEATAGSILAQTPLPGQEVSPGTTVEVFVSTGARRPSVPSVRGMPLALATRALQTAGFQVLVQDTPGVAFPGAVVGTDPPPGTAVQLPATVQLWVSSSAPMFEMPTLIGMVEATAVRTVEESGLRIGGIDYQSTEFGEPGSVVTQEPAPGDSVNLGAEVRLRVNALGPPTSFQDDDAPFRDDRDQDRLDDDRGNDRDDDDRDRRRDGR